MRNGTGSSATAMRCCSCEGRSADGEDRTREVNRRSRLGSIARKLIRADVSCVPPMIPEESPSVQKFSLTFARVLLAGWIGAASLFVVTSVSEQVSPDLDPVSKGTLALIRFPWYYTFGMTMLVFGLLFGLLGMGENVVRFARRVAFIMVTALAILVMAGDFLFVYLPLANLTKEEVAAEVVEHSPEFERYHEYSKSVNMLGLVLASVGTLLVCSPTWEPETDDPGRRW